MSSIYVHIPYCKKACHYCNFHFSTTKYNMEEMVEAMQKELLWRKDYLSSKLVDTVYFGGGTPSILPFAFLKRIVDSIERLFDLSADYEFTIEANPDDISKKKLLEWKSLGINRLSIGVQSFVEDDLKWMNRAHNVYQAEQSIALAQSVGFEHITIDLIYGTPTLSEYQWLKNIDRAIALGVPHLSCYALTVEERTALHKFIEKDKVMPVDENKQSLHFELLMYKMQRAGFEHYEISNFALQGYRSRHNSNYWSGRPYLGIGPAAHSFDGYFLRQWNVANNALYLKAIKEGSLHFEKEELTRENRLNEYIMTSLRTIEGINLDYLANEYGALAKLSVLNKSLNYIKNSYLQEVDGSLRLTNKGKLLADGIAADLFWG